MSARQNRPREVHGPGVADVAIIGRSYKGVPVDKNILDRRAAEDAAKAQLEITAFNTKAKQKTDWETALIKTDSKAATQRSVTQKQEAKKQLLDIRRERIRALYEEENQQFIREIGASVETELDRQARMRDRAKTLRENREQERAEFAEAKRYQQWMVNSEELRTMRSKLEHEMVAEDRVLQQREKSAIRQQQAQVDKLWDELWEADKRKKDERADREQYEQRERNRVQTELLNAQVAALQASRDAEAQLRKQEEALRLEEAQLMAEEDRRREALLVEQQRAIKVDLDKFNRRSLQIRAKEMQDEMAIDLKLIEDAVASARNEAKESLEKKRQLAQEVQIYKQYLDEMRAYDKERESRINEWLDSENQRVLQKQIDKWQREKQARVRLMNEVLSVRQEQVAAKIACVEAEKAENLRQRTVLQQQFEEYELAEQYRQEEMKQTRLDYQSRLLAQVDYNAALKAEARAAEIREAQRLQEEEEQNQARIQAQLADFTMTQTRKNRSGRV